MDEILVEVKVTNRLIAFLFKINLTFLKTVIFGAQKRIVSKIGKKNLNFGKISIDPKLKVRNSVFFPNILAPKNTVFKG